MSIELDFEDFLRSRSPLQVRLEYAPLGWREAEAARYQRHTDELLVALRSGSRARLELAVFAVEVAA